MSDLRARIAKILYSQNADEDWNGKTVTWEEASKAYRECWLHDADVLIRELKLDQPVDFTSVAWGMASFDNGRNNE